ncbi:Na+/H+ antiporter NhaA [Dinoroseobacter shibae]|jgi:NhaA family Na+:H+ antiporter|uniref:Na+/H+ antiporter NhaA n=1 Tax=Dinoroseobacter shibae TaxID=215813 RepID=UPI003BEEECC1
MRSHVLFAKAVLQGPQYKWVALALSVVAANSPLAALYALLHHLSLHIGFGTVAIEAPLIDWINQGLLTDCFLLIGPHTKHEITSGTLSEQWGGRCPGNSR